MKSLEKNHRKDIDGLRAVAVISVIIFHLGFLPLGYLGVDVFFVISGYLITKILYTETVSDSFSIVEFYLRRIRRIIPLVLFVIIVALCIGIPVMLPDDLENLSQSIISTNFMANNILLLITTGNYWDAVNEFKPLMHTWSLGVEEQFYFIVPLIFLILRKERIKWAVWVLSFLALLSFLLYILPFGKEASKFYLIQYRFFEIAFGGILAIIFQDRLIKFPARVIILFLLLLLLGINVNIQPQWTLILVVFLTGILLITRRSKFEGILLENKYVQFIGKISFSLYMWHQIVLGFGRYFVFSNVKTFYSSFSIILVTFLLSVFTFYFIERPFRDKKKVGTKKLLSIVVLTTIFTSGISFYLYSIKGVIRDVPELDLFKSENYTGNLHIKYNEEIYKRNLDFNSVGKKRILIIGDSFARDWANVLLESKFKNDIEISYLVNIKDAVNFEKKIKDADVIYFSQLEYQSFKVLSNKYKIDENKVWNIGTKNFGSNNGIFYNKPNDNNYCSQRTVMIDGFLNKNKQLADQWKDRYIDIIGVLIDSEQTIPVFTPECKFISQDCRHLTRPGAIYIARLIENKLTL